MRTTSPSLSKKKVFIVGKDYSVYNLFRRFGWAITETIKESDLVVFTGGEDISPALYNQAKHPRTYTRKERTDMEMLVYQHAKRLGRNMAGICRGAQFLNVMCGGDMWQDVDSHTTSHDMQDVRTGVVTRVSSLHHQMMIPGPDAEIVAIAAESHRREKMSPMDQNPEALIIEKGDGRDPEVIWYAKERCFAFQGHPEYSSVKGVDETFFEYIEEFFQLRSSRLISLVA